MNKSLLSKHKLMNQARKEQAQTKRQGFKNINYTDYGFKYKGNDYKILSRRSKYPYTLCKIAKKVNFTNHKTGKTYYKWVKLTGWFAIPSGYSVGSSKTLKVPNGQWKEGHKPAYQNRLNHSQNDLIQESSFKSNKKTETGFKPFELAPKKNALSVKE